MFQSKKPNSSRGVRHARKFRLRTDASRDTRCSVGRYGPVMTDSSRLQQHHTTSDDPGQGCKAHEGGIRP